MSRILYKYLDIDGAKCMIGNQDLQFTNASQLNDPFDCHPKLIDYSNVPDIKLQGWIPKEWWVEKEENDALREQPIRGDFADADEIDRRAQEKAEAMTAEYRDQIAELQDRAETGDANACYDQVILASRALENAWTLAKSAYKRLPAGMRAYPREMLHNAFAKFEEELKCL